MRKNRSVTGKKKNRTLIPLKVLMKKCLRDLRDIWNFEIVSNAFTWSTVKWFKNYTSDLVNSQSTHRQIESKTQNKFNHISMNNVNKHWMLHIFAWTKNPSTLFFTCPVYTIANLGVILINEIVIEKRSAGILFQR